METEATPAAMDANATARQGSALEAFSKVATIVSIVLIAQFELLVNPDMTPILRAAGEAAFALGLAFGTGRGQAAAAVFVTAAPILPAVLWRLTGRLGPALDVVWMVGLAGVLLRSLSWSRWHLPSSWRVLLGGWALTLALAWPVIVAREIGFNLVLLHDMGAINSFALLPAPQVVGWTLFVVFAQLLGLLWLEWLTERFAESPRLLPRVTHALWIGTTIASVVAIIQGTITLDFLNVHFWVDVRRAASTMLDANAYGIAAVFAATVGATTLWRRRGGVAAVLAVAVFGLNIVGMWASGSRTALVCAVIAAVVVAAGAWRYHGELPTTPGQRRVLAFAVIAAIVGIVVFGARGGAIGGFERLNKMSLNRTTVLSLWDRFGYGSVAMRMLVEYPFTGVGIGGFHIIAPDYWHRMTSELMPFDNAQNWWRHQAAELGVLGGLPLLLWSLLVVQLVVMRRGVEGRRLEASVPRGLLLGIGIVSLLGVPTQNAFVLLWFFLAVAWLWATTDSGAASVPVPARRRRLAWGTVTALAVAYAGAHLALAVGPLSVMARAQRADREYVTGAYSIEHLPNYQGDFLWTGQDARFVLPVKHHPLIIRLWASHPDIAATPVRVTLSAPCGVIFDTTLTTGAPVDLGLTLPESMEVINLDVAVSRTWQPSAYDRKSADARHLGVAFQTLFNGRDPLFATTHQVNWPCRQPSA